MNLGNRFIYVAAAALAATMGDLLLLYAVAVTHDVPELVRSPGAGVVLGAMGDSDGCVRCRLGADIGANT